MFCKKTGLNLSHSNWDADRHGYVYKYVLPVTNNYALPGTNEAASEGPKRCRHCQRQTYALPGTNEAASEGPKRCRHEIGVEGLNNTAGHVRSS